jgi:hypothetical protein
MSALNPPRLETCMIVTLSAGPLQILDELLAGAELVRCAKIQIRMSFEICPEGTTKQWPSVESTCPETMPD